MKKLILILAFFMPSILLAQSNTEKKFTKFEGVSSKTGSIMKFIDVKMPNIPKCFGGSLESCVRIIMDGSSNNYFLRIEETETSRSNAQIAMIEYSDLVEINKALKKIVADVDADVVANPDYLENKFITVDGFELGYYIFQSKVSWYMKLERFSESIVLIKDKETLVKTFINAQTKIEGLKAVGK